MNKGEGVISKREAPSVALVKVEILRQFYQNKLVYFADISNQLSSNKKTLNHFTENKRSEHNIFYFYNLTSLAFRSSSSFSSKVGRKSLLAA